MSKPHICDVCFKNFSNRSNLKHHMIKHNPGLKAELREKFKCPECQRPFATKQHLNLHAIQHNPALEAELREKYKCPECPATFIQKSDLNRHAIQHDSKLEAEMREKYKCPECLATFKQKPHLTQHAMQHNPGLKAAMRDKFKCPECQATFAQKSNLTYHIKTQHPNNIDLDMAQWLVDLSNVTNQEEIDIAQQLVDLSRIHPTQVQPAPISASSSSSSAQVDLGDIPSSPELVDFSEIYSTQVQPASSSSSSSSAQVNFIDADQPEIDIPSPPEIIDFSENYPAQVQLAQNPPIPASSSSSSSAQVDFIDLTDADQPEIDIPSSPELVELSMIYPTQVQPAQNPIISSSSSNIINPNECQICHRTFTTPHGVKKHMVYHNPSFQELRMEQNQCPYCNAQFLYERELKHHLSTIHHINQANIYKITNSNTYVKPCPYCQKLLNKHYLVKHIRLKHNDKLDKPSNSSSSSGQ